MLSKTRNHVHGDIRATPKPCLSVCLRTVDVIHGKGQVIRKQSAYRCILGGMIIRVGDCVQSRPALELLHEVEDVEENETFQAAHMVSVC